MITMMMSKEAMIRSLQGSFRINSKMTKHFANEFPTITSKLLGYDWNFLSLNAIRLVYNWAVRNEYICGCEQRVMGI